MGQAFIPSRSMLYGSPDRQAMIDVGRTLMGQLQDWSEEEIQADFVQQTSRAGIAFLKERNAFFREMQDNHGDDPDLWLKEFAKRKLDMSNGILKGLTQPRAKQAMQLELDEGFAKMKFDLDNAAREQKAKNLNTNFVVGREEFRRSVDYRGDESNLMARVREMVGFVTKNRNPGGMPAHPDVATPEAARLQVRTIGREMIKDYSLQQALATGDESYIDKINELGERIFGDKEPLLEPEEKHQLKRQYLEMVHADELVQKKRHGEYMNVLYEDVLGKARTMSPEEFKSQLAQTVNLPEIDKAELMKVYLTAYQMYQGTGSSPWEKTHDYGSLSQTLIDIRNGKIRFVSEIDDRWLKDGRPNWAFNDWRMVTKEFAQTNKAAEGPGYSRSHPWASMAMDKINSAFMNKKGAIPQKDWLDYTTALTTFEAAMEDPKVWGNPQEMTKALETAINPRKDRQARDYLDTIYPAKHQPGAWYPMRPDKPVQAPAEPETLEAFLAIVAQLKATNPVAAKQYYDKWIAKFW